MAKGKKTDSEPEVEKIFIKRPNWMVIHIPLRAKDNQPLIMQRLHPDTVREMVAREFGHPKKKTIRNEDREYERCFHRLPEDHEFDYGIPMGAFFNGMLFYAPALNTTMIDIKRFIRIIPDHEMYIAITKYDRIEKRVDTPKRAGITGAPDLRVRPAFHGWECILTIKYNADLITVESVVNLIAYAGDAGAGSWRPSSPKNPGPFGVYEPVFDKISE